MQVIPRRTIKIYYPDIMNFEQSIAGGGITGAIVAGLFIGYKCCYRKKFKSKCCGAEMDVQEDAAVEVTREAEMPAKPPSRVPTPSLSPQKATEEVPSLQL